jgi:hypothetical protein
MGIKVQKGISNAVLSEGSKDIFLSEESHLDSPRETLPEILISLPGPICDHPYYSAAHRLSGISAAVA